MGGASDCSCCSRSSSLRGGGPEDSAQLHSSWLWVDLSQANPQAKTGTLLIHRQQEVNLEEAHKDDQCLTKARLHSILVDCWRVFKICQFPVSWTCSVEGQAMIWRSSPLYSSTSKACSLRKTCWMLFCGRGGKNPIQLLSAGGKLKLNFHLASVPSLSCYHVNRNNLVLSHSAFTWHNDEQYTASTKISLLEFNHGWRGKDGICDKESAQVPNWTTVM